MCSLITSSGSNHTSSVLVSPESSTVERVVFSAAGYSTSSRLSQKLLDSLACASLCVTAGSIERQWLNLQRSSRFHRCLAQSNFTTAQRCDKDSRHASSPRCRGNALPYGSKLVHFCSSILMSFGDSVPGLRCGRLSTTYRTQTSEPDWQSSLV